MIIQGSADNEYTSFSQIVGIQLFAYAHVQLEAL